MLCPLLQACRSISCGRIHLEAQALTPSISIVVTAPSGLEECAYWSELLAQADGKTMEVVVVDGSPAYVDQSRPGLRHVSAPGLGIQGLIMEGIRRAQCEWVLVTEDHCRPLPGFLEQYRDAVQSHPEIDLFSGSTTNQTSTAPWSCAVFMTGLGQYAAHVPLSVAAATNANLLVRRCAVLPSELGSEGGLLNVTVPRLVNSGRFRHCAAAAVDHVLHFAPVEAVKFSYECGGAATTVARQTLPTRPILLQIFRDLGGIVFYSTVVPCRTARRFRGTPQAGLAMTLRLMVLGLARGLSILSVDVNRALGRKRTFGAH